MTRSIISLSLLLPLVGCGQYELSNRNFLEECWNATLVSGSRDEYRFQIEAIVIPAMEGGVYARTRLCPQHRLKVDYQDPEIQSRFDHVADSVVSQPVLGAGIRAEVQAKIKERRTEHLIVITVTRLISLGRMNNADTQRFISEFNIS